MLHSREEEDRGADSQSYKRLAFKKLKFHFVVVFYSVENFTVFEIIAVGVDGIETVDFYSRFYLLPGGTELGVQGSCSINPAVL